MSILPKHITSVSNAAYTKARKKIRHTAFIELNQKAVVDLTYANSHQTYHGRRLLAVDAAKVMLPDADENKSVFGKLAYGNQKKYVRGNHAFAMASVLYDVLNNIAVNAMLERCDIAEIKAAAHHLMHLTPDDIVVFDHGYCAYVQMARIAATGADFVIRCPKASFKETRPLFAGEGPNSITATLIAPKDIRTTLKKDQVPTELTVRFVRVILPTGEIEVLATSLRDEHKYPTKDFRKLYWYRWGIETFYGTIKTRLTLENFTGTSPEAIRQDFFATIFLSGLESLLTEDIDAQLQRKPTQHPQQVNNAVAFHAIKHRAFDIMMSDQDPEKIVQELTCLFLTNPTLHRRDKKPKRNKSVTRRIVNYFKQKRKVVF